MAERAWATAQTLPQVWEAVYQRVTPEHTCLEIQDHDKLHPVSYRELNAKIQCLTAYLVHQGLAKGDRVLILSDNSPNYLAFDLAVLSAGGIGITLSRQYSHAQLRTILHDTQPRFALLASYAAYRLHAAFLDDLAGQMETICYTDRLDDLRETDRVTTLASAIEQGKTYWRTETERLAAVRASLTPTDPATVVYDRKRTSLVGVVHTHATLLAQLRLMAEALPNLSPGETVLSVLSPSYPLQRYLGLYLPIALGLKPILLQTVRTAPQAIRTCKPTHVLACPSLLQALLRSWQQQSGISLKRFRRAWAQVVAYQHRRLTGQKVAWLVGYRYNRARSGVFAPLQRRFLPGVKTVWCYGEGLSASVEHAFAALQVPLVAGFGLIETAGAIALNDPAAPKLGALGKPLPGVRLNDLINGGELKVTAPSLSPGYWPHAPIDPPLATGKQAKTYNGLLYLED